MRFPVPTLYLSIPAKLAKREDALNFSDPIVSNTSLMLFILRLSSFWQSGLRFKKFSTGKTSKQGPYLLLTSGAIYHNLSSQVTCQLFLTERKGCLSYNWELALLSAFPSRLFPHVNPCFPFRKLLPFRHPESLTVCPWYPQGSASFWPQFVKSHFFTSKIYASFKILRPHWIRTLWVRRRHQLNF